MKRKYVDIGLFRTPLDGQPIAEQLTRVAADPALGQYFYDDEQSAWQLHPDEVGHFVGNYLDTETVPGTAVLKMREVAEKSWTVTGKTVKVTSLPGYKQAALEAAVAELYIRASYPQNAETVLASAHDGNAVYEAAIRHAQLFISVIRLIINANPDIVLAVVREAARSGDL